MIAFSKYYLSKTLADKLSFDNPDRALPFCGMGCSLFNMEEYELSLRCFLKAREIREKFVGEDTVDTATVYNNLGCCFMTLNRNREALAYFRIAAAIFS
jgi:tetratricopeptide (TPR) repeat protein